MSLWTHPARIGERVRSRALSGLLPYEQLFPYTQLTARLRAIVRTA